MHSSRTGNLAISSNMNNCSKQTMPRFTCTPFSSTKNRVVFVCVLHLLKGEVKQPTYTQQSANSFQEPTKTSQKKRNWVRKCACIRSKVRIHLHTKITLSKLRNQYIHLSKLFSYINRYQLNSDFKVSLNVILAPAHELFHVHQYVPVTARMATLRNGSRCNTNCTRTIHGK
jgi:hypothetical protein